MKCYLIKLFRGIENESNDEEMDRHVVAIGQGLVFDPEAIQADELMVNEVVGQVVQEMANEVVVNHEVQESAPNETVDANELLDELVARGVLDEPVLTDSDVEQDDVIPFPPEGVVAINGYKNAHLVDYVVGRRDRRVMDDSGHYPSIPRERWGKLGRSGAKYKPRPVMKSGDRYVEQKLFISFR